MSPVLLAIGRPAGQRPRRGRRSSTVSSSWTAPAGDPAEEIGDRPGVEAVLGVVGAARLLVDEREGELLARRAESVRGAVQALAQRRPAPGLV